MMVKRPAVGAEGFVLNHYDRAARRSVSRRRRRPPAGGLRPARRPTRSSATASRSTSRTGPTISSTSSRRAAATTCGRFCPALVHRRRPGDRRPPPRLGPDAHRAACANGSSIRCRRGRARTRHAVPRPGLRHAAGDDLEQCRRRPARGRRLAVEDRSRVALGGLDRPSLRSAGHLVGDLDVAALARLPGHAARHEGRGRPALPAGHQPAHRPRLAVHGRRRRLPGLAVLRGGRVQREEPVVDRDARPGPLPAAGQLPAAPGSAGERRRRLPADRRHLGALRAGEGRLDDRGDEPARRAGPAAGGARGRVQRGLRRRRRAGRTGAARPGRRSRSARIGIGRSSCPGSSGCPARTLRALEAFAAGGVRVVATQAHAGPGAWLHGLGRRPRRRGSCRRAALQRARRDGRVRRARIRPGRRADGPAAAGHGGHERRRRSRRRAPAHAAGGRLLRREHVERAVTTAGDIPCDRVAGRAVGSDDGSRRGAAGRSPQAGRTEPPPRAEARPSR